MSSLYRLSDLLAALGLERLVDGLDQITFYERRAVLSGECNNDLERVLCRAAVEQYARGGVRQHTPIGHDKTTHLFNRAIEVGVV
jgi:hypothetical protein